MAKFMRSQPKNKAPVIAMVSTICASVGAFTIEFLPHTFFLEKYKSIVQMYKLGEELPVHERVQKLFDEVLDDLNIKKPKQREKYRPFTVVGFNIMHAGVESQFGVNIGIPINYSFENKVSVDVSEFRIGNDREPLNIYHPSADDLLNSLVLSEKAKKFAIAREILMAQTDLPIYKAIESPVIITAFSLAAEVMKFQFQLARRPGAFTVLLYGISGLMGYSTWFQIRDNLQTYYEKSVDKDLANLGPDYIEGGKEFYEKLLQKNKALRVLLGESGKNEYNRDGDEIFFLRNKTTPITHRMKFFTELSLPGTNTQAV